MQSQPFFSIGVPTYNRHELLRETLDSILAQSFTDFEIIVGNDYTSEVLTCGMLGISDSRIRIINHPSNLMEVGNMNALLGLASGRYFTWLFDDDLYEPDFLQTVHDCLVKSAFPPAIFSTFRMLKPAEKFQPEALRPSNMIELTGREFLCRYSAERPEIASTCGLFETTALRSIVGGVEKLCESAIGIYCEYLLLVKCALLDRLVFIDAPFYVFRRHADSASENNVDLDNHVAAGQELVRRCGEILRHPALVNDFSANLMKICKVHIITLAYVISRTEFIHMKYGVVSMFRALKRHRKESSDTRRLYASRGGTAGIRTRLAFLKVDIFCWYLLVRHFAHFFNRS